MPTRDSLRALSAFGALAAALWAARATAGAWDKAHDWLAYELLGAVLALLALLRPGARWFRDGVGPVLGLTGLAALAAFTWWSFRQVAAVGAVAFLAGVFRVHRPRRLWLVESVAVLAFWTAAVVLLIMPMGTFDVLAARALASEPLRPVFLPALIVLCWVVATTLFAAARPAGRRWAAAVALVPIAVASARADYLLDDMAVLHWSAYLSPALVVRHGGWLLWDTPAQYGFLSTLAIAEMPFADLWQGFFVLNVALLTLSAFVLFVVFRSWRGPFAYPLALVAALAFVLWIPGWGGALVTPSAGPLRFIWCQLLLFVLWLDHRAPADRHLLAGTALWVVGCLWSAESMFYCSLTWLPPYAWLWWRGRARAWVPPAALGGTVAFTCAVYLVALGHLPDGWSFVEYVLAFRHFYTSSIAPQGSVWMLFLVLCLAGTALLFACDALTLGAAAATWAVSSYFVGNCNEVSATNLLAFLAMVLAVVGSVALEHRTRSWSIVVRLGVGTLLVVVVAIDLLANRWVNGAVLAAGSYDVPLASRRNFVDERIVAALQEAGARAGDPVALHLLVDPGKDAAWRPWLPFVSLVSLMPIPEPRQQEYCARYLARHPAAKGWLVEARDGPNATHLRAFLERTYRPTRVVEREPFRVTAYERRAK